MSQTDPAEAAEIQQSPPVAELTVVQEEPKPEANALIVSAMAAAKTMDNASKARQERTVALSSLLGHMATKHVEALSTMKDKDQQIADLESANDSLRRQNHDLEDVNRRLYDTLTWLVKTVEKSHADLLSDEQRIAASLITAEHEMKFMGADSVGFFGGGTDGSLQDIIRRLTETENLKQIGAVA